VAIIGILAALLIPNAMAAIQKAKQKGTMKDMNSVSTAVMDYITDKGYAPTAQSAWDTFDIGFISALQGFYLKIVPTRDQWGYGFYAVCGSNSPQLDNVSCTAVDDYVIGSGGRNGSFGEFSYDPTSPGSGYFEITGMASFNNDLVIWNGSWIQAPKTGQQ